MNLFESTFEKHKKLAIDEITSNVKKSIDGMSPEELSKEMFKWRGVVGDRKAPKKERENAITNYRYAYKARGKELKKNTNQQTGDDTNALRIKFGKMMDLDLPQFVPGLKAAISDEKVQRFLMSAKKDSSANDDIVKISQKSPVKVGDLYATQTEVFLDKSLAFPMENDPTQIKKYIVEGFSEKMPALVRSGKYIIDGHHRWSQIFCWNPDAMVNTYNVTFEGADGVDDILKKIHLSIAANTGDVPLSNKGGVQNLFSISEDAITTWLFGKLSKHPQAFKVFTDSEVVNKMKSELGVDSVEANSKDYFYKLIAPFIYKHVEQLKNNLSEPAYSRQYMPQSEEGTPVEDFINTLKGGNVNFDVKTEGHLFESTFNKFKNLYTK